MKSVPKVDPARIKLRPMTPGVSRAARVRAYVAGLVVTVGLAGVAKRAWSLQVDDGERYKALAERQHEVQVALPAPRGDVLDAHDRPLAVSTDAPSIWANPHEVRDVSATADQLAALLGGDARVLEAKLAGDHRFVWLERHVTPEVAKAVTAAKLAGVEIATEPRRWYPSRAIGGPVIGRADLDGKGVDGIELAMNAQLTGQRGDVSALRDARGHTMLAGGVGQAVPGQTVHLTLDRSLQAIAEDALGAAMAQHKAKDGVVVILDVATSHVLAMASSPTFDPNAAEAHGRNLAVTDAFEAGSVMKIFSVASALDAGAVTPDTGFEIGGSFQVSPKVKAIHDVDFDAYLTVSGIVKRSSNIGASKIALRLGREKLHAGLAQFGFGHRTGIELPGERNGRLRDASTWRDIELATMSYGYGLTVTPLQVAAALASIGNHGVYREPRIVDEVVDGDGNVTYRGEGAAHQAVSPKTADEMMTILESVFDKGKNGKDFGTAHAIDVAGFRCAGKTGTAHKYDPAVHKYTDRYLASFAGLAPAVNPRLAIVVMIDEPSGGDYYGASVSGPVFAQIASESLRYLGVPGDPLAPPVAVAAANAPKKAHRDRADDDEHAPAPAPPPPPDVPPDGDAMIPDFTGMGIGKALEVARALHVPVDVDGSGRVVSQDPPAGPAPDAPPGELRLALHFAP